MTRSEYIAQFIKKHGDYLAMNVKGEHVYLVSIEHLAKVGMKQVFAEISQGKFRDVKGTPEAEQNIPDQEIVNLISVIQGAPAAPVGIYKLPDDPMGVTRVSIGGNTQEAVYATYRGNIETVIRITEICLHLLKEQAKKGEAPPPPNPEHN